MVENDYLEHYGRLGMKWGQHIFGRTPTQYYEKGVKRISRYDKKASKERGKSEVSKNKYYDAQISSQTSMLFRKGKARKAARLARKTYKEENRAIRQENKAYKLANKMKSIFAGVKVGDIDPDLKAVGEKYANMTMSDIQAKSKTATQFLRDSMSNYGTVQAYNNFRDEMFDVDKNQYNTR